MRQERLDLSLSLTARYPNLRNLLVAVVYSSRGGLETTAAKMDRSPSELCKMLTLGEGRKLDIDDFVRLIASTGDTRPVEWLVEKFVADPKMRQQQAIEQIASLLPALNELVAQADIAPAPAVKARR